MFACGLLVVVCLTWTWRGECCPFLRSGGVDKDVNITAMGLHPPLDADADVMAAGEHQRRRLNGESTPSPTRAPLPNPVCRRLRRQSPPTNPNALCQVMPEIYADFIKWTPEVDVFRRSNLFGAAVRLAFHDAGEVNLLIRNDPLRSDGCLSSSSDNAGLIDGSSMVATFIEWMYQKYCDVITRADFWVLFAKFVVEYAASEPVTMPFFYGRSDASSCPSRAPRLPAAGFGLDAIQLAFVGRMGLTLDDAVTLIGAHSLGHVHVEHSGYGFAPIDGVSELQLNAWDSTPAVLDNKYYQALLEHVWEKEQALTQRFANWATTTSPGHIMMNSDMALAYDISTTDGKGELGQRCGNIVDIEDPSQTDPTLQCLDPDSAAVTRTQALVQQFAANNRLFLDRFVESFVKLTSIGYARDPSEPNGKFGRLRQLPQTCFPAAI